MRLPLLLAAIAGLAFAQPFSHRIHLGAKPTQEACLQCHNIAEIGVPKGTHLARFDHQLHLKLGNVAPLIAAAIDKKTYLSPASPELRAQLNTQNPCEACHRGLEVSDRPDRSGLPQMADCLVCHNQIDPPYSCDFCHAKGAKLTPASHTPDFMDIHTSGKLALDKTTCAVCHGRKFHCLGCH